MESFSEVGDFMTPKERKNVRNKVKEKVDFDCCNDIKVCGLVS